MTYGKWARCFRWMLKTTASRCTPRQILGKLEMRDLGHYLLKPFDTYRMNGRSRHGRKQRDAVVLKGIYWRLGVQHPLVPRNQESILFGSS